LHGGRREKTSLVKQRRTRKGNLQIFKKEFGKTEKAQERNKNLKISLKNHKIKENKKDFIALDKAIEFQIDNPIFDRVRFLTACGVLK
jgi:hypothetical protein